MSFFFVSTLTFVEFVISDICCCCCWNHANAVTHTRRCTGQRLWLLLSRGTTSHCLAIAATSFSQEIQNDSNTTGAPDILREMPISVLQKIFQLYKTIANKQAQLKNDCNTSSTLFCVTSYWKCLTVAYKALNKHLLKLKSGAPRRVVPRAMFGPNKNWLWSNTKLLLSNFRQC